MHQLVHVHLILVAKLRYATCRVGSRKYTYSVHVHVGDDGTQKGGMRIEVRKTVKMEENDQRK